MIGDSISTAIFQKALDGTWTRQQAISNNIANSETPRYKALEVDFETSLNNALYKISSGTNGQDKSKQSAVQTIMDSDIRTESYDLTSNQLDQNNVDLDSENIDMAKTVTQYYYLVSGINSSFSRIKYALSEGK
ncbi:MAG: flagellar basal-body rod protein FlgB [Eubacteriaceae bacterium]|jgi:flagellar basal-body rod protein FlgB|nr:flagellar basal-body rod protein FlgB [Eubacteriaceae bacterium]